MPGGKGGGGLYADDDFEDEDYDDYVDDYDEQYDQYDEPAAAPQQPGKIPLKGQIGAKSKASQPAAAAGASALARCLCDPPPRRPSGRPQRGGRTSSQSRHELPCTTMRTNMSVIMGLDDNLHAAC